MAVNRIENFYEFVTKVIIITVILLG